MFRYNCLILFLVVFLGACQVKVRYPAEIPSKSVIKSEEIYWLWGLVGEKEFEVYDLCPEGRVYEVHIYNTLLQSTYTALSLGIYSPRTISIVCSIRGE
ncbi:MAG: hypothetical protein H8E38_10850 [SAR324 cluster bacterium]|nr:hypothetical protein [SAR324 cluster bacterium]MBL7035319.1 hypothetical protein [SAR324 cluster bacterium]